VTPAPTLLGDLQCHLLRRLHEVRRVLGLPALPNDPALCFADALDSMGFVEFLGIVAEDCGVSLETLESATGRRYGTVADLATTLERAGLRPVQGSPTGDTRRRTTADRVAPPLWLAACNAVLPGRTQSAAELDALLQRPPGWFQEHAGIQARCIWTDEDVVAEAAGAARTALRQVDVGARLEPHGPDRQPRLDLAAGRLGLARAGVRPDGVGGRRRRPRLGRRAQRHPRRTVPLTSQHSVSVRAAHLLCRVPDGSRSDRRKRSGYCPDRFLRSQPRSVDGSDRNRAPQLGLDHFANTASGRPTFRRRFR
jgi:hypothetical protein